MPKRQGSIEVYDLLYVIFMQYTISCWTIPLEVELTKGTLDEERDC